MARELGMTRRELGCRMFVDEFFEQMAYDATLADEAEFARMEQGL